MVAVVRLILAALLLAPAVVQAFVTAPMNLLAPSTAPLASRAAVSTPQTCICMACRKNMKKDKRLRNRANAFRFKKASTGNRFNKFNNFADRNAQKEKETEDGEWISLVFTHSAAAAAAELEQEEAAAKQ